MKFKYTHLIIQTVLSASTLLLAACEDPNPPEQVKCIDTQGNTVFDLTLPADRRKPLIIDSKFKEGRLTWGRGKWSYTFIDGKGEIQPGTHNRASYYSEGLAAVRDNYVDDKTNEATDRWGFIDRTGKAITEIKYDFAIPFSDNIGATFEHDKGYSYIDLSGKPLFGQYFKEAYPFGDGKAIVNFKSSDNTPVAD